MSSSYPATTSDRDEFACPAEFAISLNTVSTHRQGIASKLGVAGAELVRRATVYNQTR